MRTALLILAALGCACTSTDGTSSPSADTGPVGNVFPDGFCGEWTPDDSMERPVSTIGEVSDAFDALAGLDSVPVTWADGTQTTFDFAFTAPDPTLQAVEIAYQSAICGTVLAWIFDITVDEMGTADGGATIPQGTAFRGTCSDTAPETAFLGLPADICGASMTLSLASGDIRIADERLADDSGLLFDPTFDLFVDHDAGSIALSIEQKGRQNAADTGTTTPETEVLLSAD